MGRSTRRPGGPWSSEAFGSSISAPTFPDWSPPIRTPKEHDVIKEHDRVVLTHPLPAERLEAGDVGTVAHVYPDGRAFEVEFVALDGHTTAVATVPTDHLRPVTR
jgi:Domain of unknown function (DUF4926)